MEVIGFIYFVYGLYFAGKTVENESGKVDEWLIQILFTAILWPVFKGVKEQKK